MGILKQSFGCQVTGIWSRIGGLPSGAAIEISPSRGGVWAGRVFTRESVIVQADSAGNFRTPPLPPSTVAGVYTFSGGGMSLEVDIPDGVSQISLEELLAQKPEKEGESDGDSNA